MTYLQNRSILDKELTQMRENILRLASLVDTAIEKAMSALEARNTLLAQEVLDGDDVINALRFEIEKEALRTLATQQPAAIDLRTTIVGMHLATELERIGDHAAGIAGLVARMEEEDEIKSLHKLPKMTNRARKMLNQGIQAFVENDVELAHAVFQREDKLDRHYQSLVQILIDAMQDDAYIRRATFLLWIGHNVERIGDRATNIAERVIFMATGQMIEIADTLDE
ncbi:MAG: phosphate signaling complex protein PhoU [Anaerolineales bacterium]|nr:phosphate signaling complex protein PhoU [Anaerolineales bacterium]